MSLNTKKEVLLGTSICILLFLSLAVLQLNDRLGREAWEVSPRHGEGAACLSACECHKIHFLVQPMAGTPQGRVPVDPHPFLGHPFPAPIETSRRCGEEGRGRGRRRGLHQTPASATTPRVSDVPSPLPRTPQTPGRGDSTERRDTGRGLLNQEALFTQ